MSNPHPNPENQFKPGQSGNPAGRPKKEQALTDLLRNRLESESVETKSGTKITGKQAIVDKMLAMALSGDRDALKYIWDRIDGRATTFVDVDASKIGDIIIMGDADDAAV